MVGKWSNLLAYGRFVVDCNFPFAISIGEIDMELIFSRVSSIWLSLLLITGVMWWSTENLKESPVLIIATVLAAAVKVRYVFLDFMEVRRMPIAWRAAFEAWIVIVSAIVILGFI
jgi:hypothetical protein